MSERKVKVNGVLTAFSFDKTKKYKYNSSGNLVEATSVADNDIVFSGSKSSLRRIADLERNVSVLATRLTTTDGDNYSDAGYVEYAAKAGKWSNARTLSLTGAITGSASIDGSGNVSLSTTATNDPTLTLTGDASGSATFTNLGNATLTVTVANDSHTHDGRYYTESEIDAKLSANATASNTYTDNAISALVNGASAAFDTLKEIQDAMATDTELASAIAGITTVANANKWTTARTITLGGDLSGSVSIDGSANVTLSAQVANNSHTHTYLYNGSNIKATATTTGVDVTGNAIASGYLKSTSGTVNLSSWSIDASSIATNSTVYYANANHNFTGSIVASGDVTAYSDDRLKTDVETIGGALDKVSKVRGVNFTRKEDGSRSTGVVAQELAAVLPEAVKTDANGMHHVAYGNITGLLIEAIKELKDEIDYLKGLK